MITLILLGVRIGTALFFMPMFDKIQFNLIKVATGLIIAYVALPFVHPVSASTPTIFVGLVVANATMGALSGLVLRFLILAVEYAGGLIDIDTGFGFVREINPASSTPSTPITIFLSLLMASVFFGVNGQDYFIQAVVNSFDMKIGANLVGISQIISTSLLAGLEMALPLLVTLIAFDISFGTISRYSQQINAFSVGFGLRMIIGLMMVFFMIPFFGTYFQSIGINSFQNIYALIGR